MISSDGFTQEQQELVDLLCNELTDLVEATAPQFAAGFEKKPLLRDFRSHSENFGNAAELIGLAGLADCCQHLAGNFAELLEQSAPLTAEQLGLLQSWADYIQNYLQHLADTDNLQSTIDALLAFLNNAHWPTPLSEEQAAKIAQRFSHSSVSLDEPAAQDIPVEADEAMVSLAIDSEVRPELLEGLLLELPGQIQEFVAAITAFVDGADDVQLKKACLEKAQRIAHTLKGAANVVDVRGIANLMHYTEEVLQSVTKGGYEYTPAFASCMQEVSDCLEVMGEYLLGTGERPDNAVAVLQQLMDWNRTAAPGPAPAAVPEHREKGGDANKVEAITDAQTSPALQDKAKAFLRVPDALVSELLQLAGENIIANTRVYTQTEQLGSDLAQIAGYHRQLRKLADELAHLIEIKSAFSNRNEVDTAAELDPLELERYSELHSFCHQLQELALDSQEQAGQAQERLEALKAVTLEQSKLNRENRERVLRTRMVEVSTQSPRFQRCVRQASRLTGKEATLTVSGDNVLMDSHVLNELVDPLMHLLRNAVDHGVEAAEARRAVGKATAGNITLAFERQGEFILVRCSDDGPGLNLADIETKGREKGLLPVDANADNTTLHSLILQPGFSTRSQVSQTSGRGIGLDVVKTKVEQLGGRLMLESVEHQGTTFTIALPVTLLSSQALIVEAENGAEKLAVVSRGVERIVYLSAQDIVRLGEGLSYVAGGDPFPVYSLAELTGSTAEDEREQRTMLTVTGGNSPRCGVLVNRVLASREVVVKPLNRFTCRSAGVIGATVAGDGAVYPVLDLAELIDAAPRQSGQRAGIERRTGKVNRPAVVALERPIALVVDDSLSARRSLAQFVADIGLDVRTAKDGFEAITLLNEKLPALLLVDLEMPRMNGLELTQHIRSRESTRDIPVIMITSRTTEKHRRLAAAAGVNIFLNKPFSEDELLNSIQTQIAC